MPRRETHRSLPETWKFFDPSEFNPNDEIVFHNPNTNKWEKGRLSNSPPPNVPVIDRDNRRIYLENTAIGGAAGIELRIPPKKVDKLVLKKKIKISVEDKPGRHTLVDYQAQLDTNGDPIWNVGPDGEIEVTLLPVTPGANHKEISNVNIDTLKNVQEIEQVERAADAQLAALRTQIDTITNIRRKELTTKLTALDKEIKDLVNQAGHFDEMGDLEKGEIENVSVQIKELRSKVEDGVRTIQAELVKVRAELANANVGGAARKRTGERVIENVDNLHAAMAKDWSDYEADQVIERTHAAWAIKDAAWVAAEAAFQADLVRWNANPNSKGSPPKFTLAREVEPPRSRGLIEPDPVAVSKDKNINAFRQYEINIANANSVAGLADANLQPYRDLQAEVVRRLAERKRNDGMVSTDTYPSRNPLDPNLEENKIIGEIFLKVAKEWKDKEVVEAAKFDFKKEQDELEAKIKELRTKADALSIKNKSLVTLADTLRTTLNTLSGYTKDTTDIQNLMANIWRDVGNHEIELFKEESRTTGRSEKAKEMDMDLPPSVLREILDGREQQVSDVMRQAYTNQIEGGADMRSSIEEAMRRLFEPSPTQTGPRSGQGNLQANDAMIARLRQYGIKDWRHFKKLWDEKLSPKAAELMHSWAQDDIRNEIARNTSQLDKIRAIGGQLAIRAAINLALVGGGAMAATAIFASGGIAGLALAAAGGAVGGGVRAGLQKFVFGNKWFEDRQAAQLKELAQRERERAINNLMTGRFGADHANNPAFAGDSLRMFTSMLAQAGREASSEYVQTDQIAEAQGLTGDSRRIYIEAIKDIETAGDEPSEKQKLACAIAIKRLQERTAGTAAEAAPDNPMIVRILDGVMQGYTGNLARADKYGNAGIAATVVVGAGVGAAFFADQAWARAALGGAGGAMAGYGYVENRRTRAELETARATVEQLFDNGFNQFNQILGDRENNVAIAPAFLDNFTNNVQRLNRLLHGHADTMEDQRASQVLANEKGLRAQVENLVYQAYRRGIFVQRAIGEMENHSKAATNENLITTANKTNDWFRKNGTRALGIVGGAAIGAVSAVILGRGFQEIGKNIKHMVVGDTGEIHRAPVVPRSQASIEARAVAAASAAAIDQAPAPTVTHPDVAPTPEYAPARPAGLIDAPTKVTGVDDWRHQIMEKMGYRFHGGKIDHALRFHPGAKITLLHHDGTPVLDSKGHAVDYTFKKGGSTWDALDHLQSKAKGLIKIDDIPTIKIEGADAGKVEVLDNYQVESHIAGKTQIVEVAEPVAKTEVPSVRNVGPNEFKQGYFSQQHTDAHGHTFDDDHSTYYGRSGKPYEPVFGQGEKTPFAFKDTHGNLFDSKTGEYFATAGQGHGVSDALSHGASTHTETSAPITAWAAGGVTENKAGLESMLKGSPAGGPAEVGTPQVGGGKTEIIKTINTPVAEPGIDTSLEVPPAFKPQYTEWSEVKQNFNESSSKDLGITFQDKAGLSSNFMNKVDSLFRQHPDLLKNVDVQKILDNPRLTAGDKLHDLTEVMAGKQLALTKEEQLMFGSIDDIPTDSADFEKMSVKGLDGAEYEVAVAKGEGSHVAVYKNIANGAVLVQTDPNILYNHSFIDSIFKTR